MEQEFVGRIEAFMREQNMVRQGDGVIVGISGGADSVCLLSVLCALRDRMGLRLYGVHVHHGIRGEGADGDADFVKALCERMGVPAAICRYEVPRIASEKGWSLEEAGRNCRYEALEEERKKRGAAVIAVAHHRDDQAETVLMNLMRGSGLLGLSGMRPVRSPVIRPLMCVDREEILKWLSEQGISFREDESNTEDCYKRNRIRHELLPWMETWNPKAVSHIVAAAQRIGLAQDFLEQQAEAFLQEEGRKTQRGMGAECEKLMALHPAVRREALRQMVPGGLKDISEFHILKAEELLLKGTGKAVSLPAGRLFYREYDWLYCGEAFWEREEESEPFPGLKVVFSRFLKPIGGKFPENRYTKWFDCDKIKATALIRTRETGDYIMLPGGKKKTVKAYMIDEKIPQRERDRIPLLADGKHVLWIIGYRISEGCKVTPETQNILQVQIRGESCHE